MRLFRTALRAWREYVIYCKVKARYWQMIEPIMPMELGKYPERHVLWEVYGYAQNTGLPHEWIVPLHAIIMSRTGRGKDLLTDLFMRLDWGR